jgi:predicted transcriptional regulator
MALSNREREILDFLKSRGKVLVTAPEIAESLGVDRRTVRYHIKKKEKEPLLNRHVGIVTVGRAEGLYLLDGDPFINRPDTTGDEEADTAADGKAVQTAADGMDNRLSVAAGVVLAVVLAGALALSVASSLMASSVASVLLAAGVSLLAVAELVEAVARYHARTEQESAAVPDGVA